MLKRAAFLGALSTFASVLALAANPPSQSPLFQSHEVVNLEIKANFTKMTAVAKEDGDTMETPDRKDPKYFVDGELRDLSSPTKKLKIRVRARGMSSLWEGEAEFPKLRVEIADSPDLKGSLFKGSKNFRINTHVSTDPKKKWTEMSRLMSENSPLREALAYDEARVLGLETPSFRRAKIHYIDEGTKKDFTRYGLIIESDKKVGERLSAKKLTIDEFLSTETSRIDPVYGAKYFLFHALIANADTGLKVNEPGGVPTEFYRPIFNTTVFERPDGNRFAIVYDLDMGRQITGWKSKEAHYSAPSFGLNYVETVDLAMDLVRLRHRFTAAQLQAAVNDFKAKREELKKVIASAVVDDEGRKIAESRLKFFFPVLDLVMGYKLTGQEGVFFYADSKKTKQKIKEDPVYADGRPGALRLGTPVKVLGSENGMLKVEILDYRNDLEEGENSVGYIEASSKIVDQIDDSLIGRLDPRELVQP